MATQDNTAPLTAEQAPVEYRDIPGYPGYRVGNDGSVWSRRSATGKGKMSSTWRRLKFHTHRSGYKVVTFYIGGRKNQLVHRLVLLSFIGPCPDGKSVRHLDGDPGNNNLHNLCYGTQAENEADKVAHGRDPKGERHGHAKLTDELVRQIRAAYAAGGVTQKQLAEQYNMTQSKISYVVIRRTWKHVT
jgi:hypothetical protein